MVPVLKSITQIWRKLCSITLPQGKFYLFPSSLFRIHTLELFLSILDRGQIFHVELTPAALFLGLQYFNSEICASKFFPHFGMQRCGVNKKCDTILWYIVCCSIENEKVRKKCNKHLNFLVNFQKVVLRLLFSFLLWFSFVQCVSWPDFFSFKQSLSKIFLCFSLSQACLF